VSWDAAAPGDVPEDGAEAALRAERGGGGRGGGRF
jgi:hypothetical protein